MIRFNRTPRNFWSESDVPLGGSFIWNEDVYSPPPSESDSRQNEKPYDSAANLDYRFNPIFWSISKVSDLKTYKTFLPLVVKWVNATFESKHYGIEFTSDSIDKPHDTVYEAQGVLDDVQNNLAVDFNFSTQSGLVSAKESSKIYIGVIASDLI